MTATDLGEPFASYLALLQAHDAADRALHAARVAGDQNAIVRAELARDSAAADIEHYEQHLDQAFQFIARLVERRSPGRLAELLGLGDHVQRLDNIKAVLAEVPT